MRRWIFCILFCALHTPLLFAQTNDESEQFAREFYNEYLDSLPDRRALSDALLRRNIMDALRRILPSEDTDNGQTYIDTLDPDGVSYHKVTLRSPFVRGLLSELPHIRATDYMYIIKTGPYMLFITYRADPRRFTIAPYQNQTIRTEGTAPGEGGTDLGITEN